MARSVAELLPRPFAELTVDDVTAILANVGEERESLFFERKLDVTAATLAKSCAAFANTQGGLLLVGIPDDRDQLVGIEPRAAEAQLWVKDSLRGHVLPLPPFRARSIPLDGDRHLLLVLVEYSSTTPHLLTRSGAIYVRNPGSSDPVPIHDQRRLLELFERGERARTEAVKRATAIAAEAPADVPNVDQWFAPVTVALVPTGVGAWFEQELFSDRELTVLRRALPPSEWPGEAQRLSIHWRQHAVTLARHTQFGPYSGFPPRIEVVKAWRAGPLMIHESHTEQHERGDIAESAESVLGWLRSAIVSGRDVLLELGAHGDLYVAYRLSEGRGVHWRSGGYRELRGPIHIERWTTLDLDRTGTDTLIEGIAAEIGRALGIGPERTDT